jgi:predicted tellurium resistance membrane protein TerC
VVGIITLKFLAGLFIKWLEEFTHLESAGYLIVLLVGLRLFIKVVSDSLVPPEWLMLTCIGLVFLWGFSKREPVDELEAIADTSK